MRQVFGIGGLLTNAEVKKCTPSRFNSLLFEVMQLIRNQQAQRGLT
jgi:hypothetical protein